MGSDGWFSTGEACEVLGISRTTLLAAEAAGVLAAVRTPGGHRRYPAAELERYLGGIPVVPQPAPPPAERPRGAPVDAGSVRTVRDALRPVARALDAECAGLYRHGPDGWWFAGAAGIPRWLATRLAAEPAPGPVRSALRASSAELFEPGPAGFPDARSAGHGIACRVRAGNRRLGALFLVTRPGHLPLPAELRLVEAAADVLGLLVERMEQVSALRERLRRVGALCVADDEPSCVRPFDDQGRTTGGAG